MTKRSADDSRRPSHTIWRQRSRSIDTRDCIKGVAGQTGVVHGETTPSITAVGVIGDATADYAINVYFKERDEDFWFAEDQLDFVDHRGETEPSFKGTNVKLIRNESGGWDESPNDGKSPGVIAKFIRCFLG